MRGVMSPSFESVTSDAVLAEIRETELANALRANSVWRRGPRRTPPPFTRAELKMLGRR